jgi:ApbE superfamily uncharacterized protein (UPF0280 family)
MNNDYGVRKYRDWHSGEDLFYFKVQIKETDLSIGVDRVKYHPDLASEVERMVIRLRGDLETYIAWHPEFMSSLEPIHLYQGAPGIACRMADAAQRAGVGPMAAVAGAFAWETGRFLADFCENVIVENGGDLFMKTAKERLVGLIAGKSAFTNRIAIKVKPEEAPLGLCTSSATVGPSFSFGKADAAVVKAVDAYLADAVASGVGNRVLDGNSLNQAIEYAQTISGVTGVLAVIGDKMALYGNMELVPLHPGSP